MKNTSFSYTQVVSTSGCRPVTRRKKSQNGKAIDESKHTKTNDFAACYCLFLLLKFSFLFWLFIFSTFAFFSTSSRNYPSAEKTLAADEKRKKIREQKYQNYLARLENQKRIEEEREIQREERRKRQKEEHKADDSENNNRKRRRVRKLRSKGKLN